MPRQLPVRRSFGRRSAMPIDSYPSEDVFARVSELAHHTDPVLRQIDALLNDGRLYQQIRADLGRRYPLALVAGRHSTPGDAILRLMVTKQLHKWSYRETEKCLAGSLVLRWFCRVYFRAVPHYSTLQRWVEIIQPETLRTLNDPVVVLARQAKITKGRKLRIDGKVVQTTIHHPTDSSLLADAGRVLSRVIRRSKPLVQDHFDGVRDARVNHLVIPRSGVASSGQRAIACSCSWRRRYGRRTVFAGTIDSGAVAIMGRTASPDTLAGVTSPEISAALAST